MSEASGLNQKRYVWMIEKVSASFGFDEKKEAVVKKCFQDNFQKINAFLIDMSTPPKLFFFFQPRQFAHPELFISVGGDTEKLSGKCVYFLRDSTKPVKLSASGDSDHAVLCGELNSKILTTFHQYLQQVHYPMLKDQANWGQIRKESDQQAFLEDIAHFDQDLKDKIDNLTGQVTLKSPQGIKTKKIEQKPASYAHAARDPEVLDEFQKIVQSWIKQISDYMNEDKSKKLLPMTGPESNKGPDEEIAYWGRRMLSLISITEQLKTKQNRVVTGVLKARALLIDTTETAKNEKKGEEEQEKIRNLLERWREVDLAITDHLNEAKDNCRFLDNLRKVIDLLYAGTPQQITESMPSLMNSMKMIHTLSRHYGTQTRMTNLFIRITNQLIAQCKKAIYNNKDPKELWSHPPAEVIERMRATIALNDAYKDAYTACKEKLMKMKNGKQFDFDESLIFGKFIKFCRRLEKLIDMFSSILQYKALEHKKIDGMQESVTSFDILIREFRVKSTDLLDFTHAQFERDFVEFTMKNSALENSIQDFIEESLGKMNSIEKKLILAKKFQSVLIRDALKDDLDAKLLKIFELYSKELTSLSKTFVDKKNNPPISRNMTPVAGKIYWCRQLQRQISGPMRHFQFFPKLFHPHQSRKGVDCTKIVQAHNTLIKQVIRKEMDVFQKWSRQTGVIKRSLRNHLFKQSENGDITVELDIKIFELMREAKHLSILGFEIPNSACIVLLLKDKVKAYHTELTHALKRYKTTISRVPPELRNLIKPHLADLKAAIKPALYTIRWTSMHIDSFCADLVSVIDRFDHLMDQIQDILENRIQKSLTFLSKIVFIKLPKKTLQLQEFVELQQEVVKSCAKVLQDKNVEIERAVGDMINAIIRYELRGDIEKPDKKERNYVRRHYCHILYHTILDATKLSLIALRERVLMLDPEEPPLFNLHCKLEGDEVRPSPGLDDVQRELYTVAREVIKCTRRVFEWELDAHSNPTPQKPFFDKLAKDRRLAIILILLTGAISESKAKATRHLTVYNQYSWLWKEDIEATYAKFLATNPILEDFIGQLQSFQAVDKEITATPDSTVLQCWDINISQLKTQIKWHVDTRWKSQYSKKLHGEVRRDMEDIVDEMDNIKSMLDREVKEGGDFGTLQAVMDAMQKSREVHTSIDAQFKSITDRYNLLEDYLPPHAMTKDEMDKKSLLEKKWSQIVVQSDKVSGNIYELQSGYQDVLMKSVREFRNEVDAFDADYKANGPTVQGVKPEEAITRLAKYDREFVSIMRKYQMYRDGEKLFGLKQKSYPILTQTEKNLRLLKQLYGLYSDVIESAKEYKELPWSGVMAISQEMKEKFEGFADKTKRLPKALKAWDAYVQLDKTVQEFIEVVPILNELSEPFMRQRHWDRISDLTKTEFKMENFNELTLKTVLDANLVSVQEDIDEVIEAGRAQEKIEKALKEISLQWDDLSFGFSGFKERGDVILSGIGGITEVLEDTQSKLTQMSVNKHVKPFKPKVDAWADKLSEVSDRLRLWVRVQVAWMSLEAVFTAGDIAKQMPVQTRLFVKTDKDWTQRLMVKAKDLKLVVDCCLDEYIQQLLPEMMASLETCQKALDGYLEKKRAKFPRFYFVSSTALLLILSQGSDREKVQDTFEKVFDAIDRVEFQGQSIAKMISQQSGYRGVMDFEECPLKKPVNIGKHNIEDWLMLLKNEMMKTVRGIVRAGAADIDTMDMMEFIKKYNAQVSLLGIQFRWTQDCESSLRRLRQTKSALNDARNNQQAILASLSKETTEEIPTKMERRKIETLVTIQVHQVDVIADLIRDKTKNNIVAEGTTTFDWQKQLRCYYPADEDHCIVKVADFPFQYNYEYLGCKERLVITPLTDRCYISLTQAVGMCFGGAPAGPAGTGKTETVKDLSRGLGKYVVVFNCSDQMHTPDTAKIYKGICQSGAWGCFDEFNRIDLEVLSVVAQQVEAIFSARKVGNKTFTFPGDDDTEVKLDPTCGIFITMNPGYAGRQELPENLKALFRSVAMMVPDRGIIIKVKLASVGYQTYVALGVKFTVLYKLCEEQLSQQVHYDFGLRNILSVLRTAGTNLRAKLGENPPEDPKWIEEMLMMRTLRDMNLSKFVADDVPLFLSLLKDLFPNQEMPEAKHFDEEEAAMKEEVGKLGLIHHESWVLKIVQLYSTSLVRHGLMMIGPAGGGKTMATEILLKSLSAVYAPMKYQKLTINPKAITAEQMFGQNDTVSGEWTDGIFSKTWSEWNDIKKAYTTWITCDGPVDAIWIENLNTVLDDNKLLTLANGDRLPMSDNVRALFEPQDLRNASPATVSRAGIIYVSSTDLGHIPILQAWLNGRRQEEKDTLEPIFEKYYMLDPEGGDCESLDFLKFNTKNVLPVSNAHLMNNLVSLLAALLQPAVDKQEFLNAEQLERLFLYANTWAVGGLLETEDRFKFHKYFAEKAGPEILPEFKEGEIFYDVLVSEQWEWNNWSEYTEEYEYDAVSFRFSTCLIPTMNSVRSSRIISYCETVQHPVLITGSSGTAKTSTCLQYSESDLFGEMKLNKFNFSSATTHNLFQRVIESGVERNRGSYYSPPLGKTVTMLMDDLSMPEVNSWGDQPTLEIVRQLIEFGGFYSLEKDTRGSFSYISKIRYIGAMNHPGGGRNDVPNRLKRHFFAFNMTPPTDTTVRAIFGAMLSGRFRDNVLLEDNVDLLTQATIQIWGQMKKRMLPTPSKFHYIFNLRDMSRIFQGILFSPLDVLDKDPVSFIYLWLHECERVLCDKLVSHKDKEFFRRKAYEVLEETWPAAVPKFENYIERGAHFYFVDFLRGDIYDPETEELLEEAPKIYEPAQRNDQFETNLEFLTAKVNEKLDKHNEERPSPMALVIFEDALGHLVRISRILGRPRGSALLVGVGGSGRQSLTKLAAYIAGHELFRITLIRGYKTQDFLEDMRLAYTMVGKEGKKCTWILADFEIVFEDMLEYMNAVLMTGEVAGLFDNDEKLAMCADLRGPAKKDIPGFEDTPENLYRYFLDRIRDNLHIVLAFSPANEKFAERARKFPGLISGCTINWFLPWPAQALKDVSQKFIKDDEAFNVMATEEVQVALVDFLAAVHDQVGEACNEYFEKFRRRVYVTPKSYLSFIEAYKETYNFKKGDLNQQQSNINTGLEKLKQAETDVDAMKVQLAVQQKELVKAEQNAGEMLKKLEVSSAEANIKKGEADKIAAKCNETADAIAIEAAEANKELAAAMPFVTGAIKAASMVGKKEINVIQNLGNPPDLIKRIMDCILILCQRELVKVETMTIGKKETQLFIKDSYVEYAKPFMMKSYFVSTVMNFAVGDMKDAINEETMELLYPYLNVELDDFNSKRCDSVCGSATPLLLWVRAMVDYHKAALIVGPKREQLAIKNGLLKVALGKLQAAQASSSAAQATVDALQKTFEETMAEKQLLAETARLTQEKMVAANNLIASLAGEKKRWAQDAKRFAIAEKRLVGDCALACAFTSYLGPFGFVFRKAMIDEKFLVSCKSAQIPVSPDLSLIKFLVDEATIAEWNTQGLPKDELSVQNGILVTKASRFPLLIDPQSQAVSWLKNRHKDEMKVRTLNYKNLRDDLKMCMEFGEIIMVEGVIKELDPMFDSILDKNLIKKGRRMLLKFGDETITFSMKFRMFLMSNLGNPLFSPELSAKSTIIDFSVTQKGLEDQLLSRVIQHEETALEEQKQKLVQEMNNDTIALQKLDALLLAKLSESSGDLLEDVELIRVLQNTKIKSEEVKEKIIISKNTEKVINNKREQYRPVAARGSVIYFVMVSMAEVNCMYQTSLAMFLTWFFKSLRDAEPDGLVANRVTNLMDFLTFLCYQHIDRSLFESDKQVFKLMVTMGIMQEEKPDVCTPIMADLLIQAGGRASVSLGKCPYSWLSDDMAWKGLGALMAELQFFSDLKSSIDQDIDSWNRWYNSENIEDIPVPVIEQRLTDHPAGHFMRMLLLRCVRPDRAKLAVNTYIGKTMNNPKYSYTDPDPRGLAEVWEDSDFDIPIVLMLTPGADPTTELRELARKKGLEIFSCSMGEGQEKMAQRCIDRGMEQGNWALLQNCHLGLNFMNGIIDGLAEAKKTKEINPDYRLWITCEENPKFPIDLLQASIKVTNEPPAGLKAGIFRSYTSVVDAQRLSRIDAQVWKDLVFMMCFTHSVVQERRKFGPIGWCIPYEFNTSDLEASLTFLETHCTNARESVSFPTIQYMICEVQYGGRITDDYDRRMFNAYGSVWLCDKTKNPMMTEVRPKTEASPDGFEYKIPEKEWPHEQYVKYATEFPQSDNPEVFGLHTNADLTFGTAQCTYLLETMSATRPKDTSAAGDGLTIEQKVVIKADELLALIPDEYNMDLVRKKVEKRPAKEMRQVLGREIGPEDSNGFSIPLNVFLFQEIECLNRTIKNVGNTLRDLKLGIKGEIIMTPQLQDALESVSSSKPPVHWYTVASGAVVAWTSTALGDWFQGLILREAQASTWLNDKRPFVFWMTGFFNPTGFLTAMRQEVTRRHKDEHWALDDVVPFTKLTTSDDEKSLRRASKEKEGEKDGVYIRGLYLEGAKLDRKDNFLMDSDPKKLFVPMPIIHVTALPEAKAVRTGKWFDCPVYTKLRRTDLNYVFAFKLQTRVAPDYWVLRGVAALCTKD